MQREKQHIVTFVENLLGAVAVVKIDVKNGDPALACIQRSLGGNGGVIKKAVPAELIKRSMVAWRTTQAVTGFAGL